jgi:hypothetical protein
MQYSLGIKNVERRLLDINKLLYNIVLGEATNLIEETVHEYVSRTFRVTYPYTMANL